MIKCKTRWIRKKTNIIIKWLLTAIIVWFIVFNVYEFHYKLDDFRKRTDKLKSENGQILVLNNQQKINREKKFVKNVNDNKKNENHLMNIYNANNNVRVSVHYIDEKSIEFSRKISRSLQHVDCESILEWDEKETKNIKKLLNNPAQKNLMKPIDDKNYIFDKSMCNSFRHFRHYDRHPIKDSEFDFPLAFSMLVSDSVEQFERLLKVIYRPHNLYCIHVDSKSTKIFQKAISSIVQCFNNVFLASKLEHIVYGGFNKLKADINCMEDLIRSNYTYKYNNKSVKWKYLINLASNEFPLRTNYELTRILRIYNGANDIEILQMHDKSRVLYRWDTIEKNETKQYLVNSYKRKKPPPHNYTITKGISYGAFSRAFVEFALTNKYARDLLEWAKDTYTPDEWYWSTLQYNTQFHTPGGYNGGWVTGKSRFIGWKGKYPCMGYFKRSVCVFSIEDLTELVTRSEFFANRFQIESDPIAYQCMEEWINNKIISIQAINVIKYCRQLFVIPYANHPRCARLNNNNNNSNNSTH